MLLLALDTATPAITVAVHDGSAVLVELNVVDARRHGELVATQVDRALSQAGAGPGDLTEIVVGVGPGPFTGLRVGLVTARILGLTQQVPVRGVCSLDILARDVSGPNGCAVATDARRKEIYWAVYDDERRRLDGPKVARPEEVATELPVAGQGALLYPSAFPNAVAPEFPSAATLARAYLAGSVEVLAPDPLYLRRPDVRPPGPRKRVLKQ